MELEPSPPTWAEVNELLAYIDEAKKAAREAGYVTSGLTMAEIVRQMASEAGARCQAPLEDRDLTLTEISKAVAWGTPNGLRGYESAFRGLSTKIRDGEVVFTRMNGQRFRVVITEEQE